jgi:hypothetical protein
MDPYCSLSGAKGTGGNPFWGRGFFLTGERNSILNKNKIMMTLYTNFGYCTKIIQQGILIRPYVMTN